MPSLRYDDAIQWGLFRDVGHLVREVAQHLPEAIKDERQVAEEWLTSITRCLGQDSLPDTLARIAEALDAATGVGCGDTSLKNAIADLRGRAVKGCADSVQKVLGTVDDTGLLAALGALDRPLMKTIVDATQLATTVLDEIEARLRERLLDALGSKTPEEWLADVDDRLGRIDTAYAELLGENRKND